MKFVNDTGLPARLFRSEYKRNELLAIAVVKATHRLDEEAGLGPADESGPEPTEAPVETELGIVPCDRVPYKQGTDVWITGTAHTPLGVPEAAMLVALGVADEKRELLVVGDRTWTDDLRPTRPVPFERMPVVYARAFGGASTTERGALPYADNPDGRGFAFEKSAAPGTPLPNLEWPDQRIQRWSDRPTPAGFAAIKETSGLHLARAIESDSASMAGPKFKPGIFNAAHPRLVFSAVPPGTPIRLSGYRPDRALAFSVPRLSLAALIRLGSREHRLPLRLDTIGIAADDNTVQLTYRCSARYRFVAGQKRTTTIVREEESAR